MIRLLVFAAAIWCWVQLGVAQVSPALSGGLEADAGRGVITQSAGFLEMQQTCPQRVGDAWDTVSPSAWNILEIGIQVQPETFPKPRFEAYSRYSCEAPFERPRRATF